AELEPKTRLTWSPGRLTGRILVRAPESSTMQKIFRCALAVALVAFSASYSYAAPGELKLTISNGRVTIVADQVPVSLILAEWSRVGQTRIVNGERLLTNVSLEVIDWPERKALDLVLRSASGYMAAERQGVAASPSASTF